MRTGDLLVKKEGISRRYSSGLVLEVNPSMKGGTFQQVVTCAKVMWCDGHVTQEIASKMAPYYEVISHEPR